MPKPTGTDSIRIRGARQNNLKNLDLDIPARKLVVITGLSGSGKSSLAFDTLFAEGQRRYVETFSPYARQFFDRMDKPAVDSIEGIPPAIAIEQRNAVRSTRSTVGTMTEVCDYMKVLWPYVSTLHCRKCGEPVRKDSPHTIWEKLTKTEVMPDAGYRMPDGEGASPFAAASLNDQPSALGHQGSGIGYQESSVRNQGSGIGHPASEFLITFHLALSDKLAIAEQLALVAKQGFQRLLIDGQIVRLEDAASGIRNPASGITVVQDRIKLATANRSRFHEACEQAFHFGHGKLAIHGIAPGSSPSALGLGSPSLFSSRFHCAPCDLDYREPSPALFSFNHPVGACPECKGFGRVITIDYDLAIPDRSKSLADGAVKPWQTGVSADCQTDMMNAAAKKKVPTKTPFRDLSEKWQRWVIDGDPGYGTDKKHEWPKAWYGVKGYFRWLESKSYKMHVRVLLSRYRAYTKCHVCDGKRLQPDALLFRIAMGEMTKREGQDPNLRSLAFGLRASSLTLSDFYLLPIRDALGVVDDLAAKFQRTANDPLSLALKEVRGRLGYLAEVGLGYLALDRATRTLSGGETARVNLTTCLGSRLVNTLFVLDEPSVGLHPRDTDRLVKVLQRLRDQGNTVVVVEHESNVMRAADQIIDLGPGHGESGGDLIFQGTLGEMLDPVGRASAPGQRSSRKGSSTNPSSPGEEARPTLSLTAEYLSGRKSAAQPKLRPIRHAPGIPWLHLRHATRNNLADVSVDIPLRSLVCVSGVSGSGKSTLLRDILLPLLEAKLGAAGATPATSDDDEKEGDGETESCGVTSADLSGHESISRVVLVDQTLLGRTPRSNPAVYIGAFEDIREIFANTELAKQRGLNASAFSFNSGQGQCERCRGAGFEKIEMQFLSDIFVRCPDCNGRRYREHILEVKVASERHQESDEPSPRSGEAKVGQRILPAQGGPKVDGKQRGFIQPLEQAETKVSTRQAGSPPYLAPASEAWSIADLLDASVDEAILFLDGWADSKHAKKARTKLALLQEVGLGYLRVGQPINTLSGGESQRLKLVSHLAEFGQTASNEGKSTLFLFDEPTTGLHFEDVRILIAVFQRLVDAGHSVLIIEHNLDVVRSADWVIDLGPEAGDAGGRIVATGTPAEIATNPESRTGQAMNSDAAKH